MIPESLKFPFTLTLPLLGHWLGSELTLMQKDMDRGNATATLRHSVPQSWLANCHVLMCTIISLILALLLQRQGTNTNIYSISWRVVTCKLLLRLKSSVEWWLSKNWTVQLLWYSHHLVLVCSKAFLSVSFLSSVCWLAVYNFFFHLSANGLVKQCGGRGVRLF